MDSVEFKIKNSNRSDVNFSGILSQKGTINLRNYYLYASLLKEGIVNDNIVPQQVRNNNAEVQFKFEIETKSPAIYIMKNNQTVAVHMIRPMAFYTKWDTKLYEFGLSYFIATRTKKEIEYYSTQSPIALWHDYLNISSYPIYIYFTYKNYFNMRTSYYGNRFSSGGVCWGSTTGPRNLDTYYNSTFNHHIDCMTMRYGFPEISTNAKKAILSETDIEANVDGNMKKYSFNDIKSLSNQKMKDLIDFKKIEKIHVATNNIDNTSGYDVENLIKLSKEFEPATNIIFLHYFAFEKKKIPGAIETLKYFTGVI